MSTLKEPTPGILFLSILTNKGTVHTPGFWQAKCKDLYGESTVYKHHHFPMAKYYSKEMGAVEELERFFLFFTQPVPRNLLISAKKWAVEQEEIFLKEDSSRTVNIDPGLLTLENLQLATGKNFTHRIYLGEGVFSDLTLIYQQDSFRSLEWSYSDYSHPEVIEFLNYQRKKLHLNLEIR